MTGIASGKTDQMTLWQGRFLPAIAHPDGRKNTANQSPWVISALASSQGCWGTIESESSKPAAASERLTPAKRTPRANRQRPHLVSKCGLCGVEASAIFVKANWD